jgi:CRISPR/Cas system-associated endonuclease Cas3-HD
MSKKEIEQAFKKLEELICWYEYYSSSDNPIEANRVQKDIEAQKKLVKDLKNGQIKEVSRK